MPAGSTYSTIATTTLGSAVADYTFSSISGAYTDLVLVITGSLTTNNQTYKLQFNGDTGGNYSYTSLGGTGGSAASYRGTNTTYLPFFILNGGLNTTVSANIVNINNYSNTTTFKTSLVRANYGDSGEIQAFAGLWRSTSAISSITIAASAGNLSSGSMFSLYGIAAA